MTVTFSLEQFGTPVFTPNSFVFGEIWSFNTVAGPMGLPLRVGENGTLMTLTPLEGPHIIDGSGETTFALRLRRSIMGGVSACSSAFPLNANFTGDPGFDISLSSLRFIMPLNGPRPDPDDPVVTFAGPSTANGNILTATAASPLSALIPFGDNLIPTTAGPNAADFSTVVLNHLSVDSQNRLKIKGTGTVHAIPGTGIPSGLTFEFTVKGNLRADANPFSGRILRVDVTNINIFKIFDLGTTILLNIIKKALKSRIETELETLINGFLATGLAPILAGLTAFESIFGVLQTDLYPRSITQRESGVTIMFTKMSFRNP